MPFTATPTLAELRTSLAGRLGDPGNIHWIAPELTGIINDALKVWNRLTLYHRARGIFDTVANQPFYDLTTTLRDATGSLLLEKASTAQNACTTLEYRLMEPQTVNFSNPWTGTEQFSFAQITDAIQKRLSRLQMHTNLQAVELPLITVSAGNGRVSLADRSSLDVRRAAWKSLTGQFSNLWRLDEETLNRRAVGWNLDAGTPESFTVFSIPETSIQLSPVPINSGSLHVLADIVPPVISLVANTPLGLFEDFVPYLVWGALAELLAQDGPGKDMLRAQYCEQRWNEGIVLARSVNTDLQVSVNDQPVPVEALVRLDWGVPDWQQTTGAPETAAQAAPNLLAFYKVPDGIYGISADVVRNALQLSADSDRIQLADSFIGPFLDECQHVAMFKEGGAEFLATIPLHQRFLEAAKQFKSDLQVSSSMYDILLSRAQTERAERPLELVA